MAEPDFELRWGPGFRLLALPAFLPSVISSFFTQNKGGGGGGPPWTPPLDPPLIIVTIHSENGNRSAPFIYYSTDSFLLADNLVVLTARCQLQGEDRASLTVNY